MEFVFIFVSPPLQKILMEHASDDPKLSFTGKPIVKWPKRVSWINFLFLIFLLYEWYFNNVYIKKNKV